MKCPFTTGQPNSVVGWIHEWNSTGKMDPSHLLLSSVASYVTKPPAPCSWELGNTQRQCGIHFEWKPQNIHGCLLSWEGMPSVPGRAPLDTTQYSQTCCPFSFCSRNIKPQISAVSPTLNQVQASSIKGQRGDDMQEDARKFIFETAECFDLIHSIRQCKSLRLSRMLQFWQNEYSQRELKGIWTPSERKNTIAVFVMGA